MKPDNRFFLRRTHAPRSGFAVGAAQRFRSTCRPLTSSTNGAAPFPTTIANGAKPNDLVPSIATAELTTNAVGASIIVEAPVAKVYRRWLRVEDYPRFMRAIKSVRKLDANHFAMEGKVGSQQFNVVLEILLRVPERRIAWRLLHDYLTTGMVGFVSLSRDQTEINLKMMSSFGGGLSDCVRTYLQEFKSLIEQK
jgi:uncharacterized membrane protein